MYFLDDSLEEILVDDYVWLIVHNEGTFFKLNKIIWNNIKYFIVNRIKIDKKYQFILNDLLRYRVIKTNSLKKTDRIVLQCTRNCNLKCKHCFVEKDSSNGSISYELIDKILELSPREIVITGGEPLVLKSFKEYMFYIKERFDGKLILMSNGTLVNQDNVIWLKDIFDRFDLSLDGWNEKSTLNTRGVDVFDKVINTCKLLRQYNKEVSLSLVYYDRCEGLEEFFELCSELRVEPVVRKLYVSKNVSNNIFDFYSDGWNGYRLETIHNLKEEISYDIYLRRCSMISNQLFVDMEGKLYPCPALSSESYCIGNIYDTFWDDRAIFIEKLLNEEKFIKCKNCKLRAACWECISDVINYSIDETVFSEFCKASKLKWKRIFKEEE